MSAALKIMSGAVTVRVMRTVVNFPWAEIVGSV